MGYDSKDPLAELKLNTRGSMQLVQFAIRNGSPVSDETRRRLVADLQRIAGGPVTNGMAGRFQSRAIKTLEEARAAGWDSETSTASAEIFDSSAMVRSPSYPGADPAECSASCSAADSKQLDSLESP